MMRRLFGVAAAFALLGATPALAQLPGVEVEPYLGVYVPPLDLADDRVDIDGFPSDVGWSQKEALAFGGRITVWLPGPLGIEGNFVYALSDVEQSIADSARDFDANAWALDGRLILKFGVPLAPISFHVNGGIALIDHGGDGYDVVTDGDSSVGGVVGAGLRVKLPGLLGVRLDAQSYLYSAELTVDDPDFGGEVTFGNQFQADIVLSAGLVISLTP